MSDDSIQLRDQVGVLRRRWRVVASTVLVAIGLGLLVSLLQTPVYVASTEVLLAARPDTAPLTAEQVATEARAVVLNADEVIGELGLDESSQDLIDTLTVTPDPDGAAAMTISVARADGDESAQIANTLASMYLDATDSGNDARVAALDLDIERLDVEINDLVTQISGTQPGPARLDLQSTRRRLLAQRSLLIDARARALVDSELQGGGAQVLTPAVAPAGPSSPDLLRNLALAAVLGLLAGIGAAYLRDHFDDVVRDESTLGEDAQERPVLARIPRWREGSGAEPVTLGSPRAPASEAYRALGANTRSLLAGRRQGTSAAEQGKVLLVSSASPSEGKTSTAVNLAVVAAATGQRVVLVDANLRRPALHSLLRLPGGRGLVDVLNGTGSARSALVDIGVEHLLVLPAGSAPPNPAELLTSPGLLRLLAELRREADLVIVDSAAILLVADALDLAGNSDVTVLVVRDGVSRGRDVAEAVRRIDRAGGSVAGLVMNDVSPQRRTRDYYASSPYDGQRGKWRRGGAGDRSPARDHIVPGFAAGTPTDP